MSNDIYGVYEYSGVGTLNPMLINEENIYQTALHELIHKQLTENTPYGDFVSHVKRMSKVIKEYEHSATVLENRMIKVQETVAYLIEHLFIKQKSNEHDFKVILHKMKKENRLYFNMVNKLDYLLQIEINDNNFLDIINLIKFMGIASLSFYFPKMKMNQIINVHKLTTYLKQHDINPNEKFEKINKFVKQRINEGLSITNVIGEVAANFAPKQNGFEEDFREVIKEHVKTSRILEYYPQIFENLTNIAFQNKKTGFIKVPKEEVSEIDYLQIGKVKDNVYPVESIQIEEFKRIIQEDFGSLYVYGSYIDKQEDEGYLYYSLEFKCISNQKTYRLSERVCGDLLEEFIDLIHIENAIILTPLAYDFKNETLIGLGCSLKRYIYVYFDIPYAYARLLLKEMLKDKESKPAFYVEYPNFYLLVIQVQEKYIFLVPFISLSTHTLENDLEKDMFKIHFVDTDKAFEEGRLNDKTINMIDTIVNSIMELPLVKNNLIGN